MDAVHVDVRVGLLQDPRDDLDAGHGADLAQEVAVGEREHLAGRRLGRVHGRVDERLDVLLHIKWTVKEFDCNLTRDIVELIDREADMLNRGRSEASLTGLRKRLANLYLQFIETPEFNPEAARFQKAPQELTLRPNVKPIAG